MLRAPSLLAALAISASLVAGCGTTTTTPAETNLFPSDAAQLTLAPFTWSTADTLTKPSVETGKIVVAVLLKGDYGAFGATVYFDYTHLVNDKPAGQFCASISPPIKLLDPLNPDAVQPALPSDFAAGAGTAWRVESSATQYPTQYAGWVSWQVDPSLVRCDRPDLPFEIEADIRTLQIDNMLPYPLATFQLTIPISRPSP